MQTFVRILIFIGVFVGIPLVIAITMLYIEKLYEMWCGTKKAKIIEWVLWTGLFLSPSVFTIACAPVPKISWEWCMTLCRIVRMVVLITSGFGMCVFVKAVLEIVFGGDPFEQDKKRYPLWLKLILAVDAFVLTPYVFWVAHRFIY